MIINVNNVIINGIITDLKMINDKSKEIVVSRYSVIFTSLRNLLGITISISRPFRFT